MKTYYILLFFLPFLFSCETSKKATDNNKTSENKTQVNTCRFIASFISKGAGTDRTAMNAMNEYLKEFESKNNVKIAFEKYPWGKEGEMDYCFSLNEIKKDKQASFIEGFKSKVGTSGSVLYQENAICKHKK